MKIQPIVSITLTFLLAALARAGTVSTGDPNAGGIGYAFSVEMGGLDTVNFKSHVGAWSWEDNALFNEGAGEPPVGWTHTSNWVALKVSTESVLKVRIERDATVPWPGSGLPDRLASVASMYPSFTIWKNWDNDLAPEQFKDMNGNRVNDVHKYYNRGNVDWAEDLVFLEYTNNSTETFIEKSIVLQPGNYSLVIGSNAPATDADRQGYKATFTTSQDLPITIVGDLYYTATPMQPVTVATAAGVLANDGGVSAADDTLLVKTAPKLGSVTLNGDGSFTYSPGAYFAQQGYDTFDYQLLINGDANSPTPVGTVVIVSKASMAGTYGGHIKNVDTGDISGIMSLNVTPAGLFTAKVQLLGKSYPLAGKLMPNGDLKLNAEKLEMHGHLSVHGDGDRHAHIHIHGDGGLQHFEGKIEKSPFSVQFPPPSLGDHRLALEFESITGGAGSTLNGAGTVSVKAHGAATVVGKLGNGLTFSSSTAVLGKPGTGPLIPVYASVFNAPGSVSGTLTFGPAALDNATGGLKAMKPSTPMREGFTVIYNATTTKRAPVRQSR